MCSLLYFFHMFTLVQTHYPNRGVALLQHRVAAVCAFPCHAKTPETFLSAAADHTLRSLNSLTPEERFVGAEV